MTDRGASLGLSFVPSNLDLKTCCKNERILLFLSINKNLELILSTAISLLYFLAQAA